MKPKKLLEKYPHGLVEPHKPQVGRPKTAEPTTAIRVPDAILQDVKNLIAKHHARKK